MASSEKINNVFTTLFVVWLSHFALDLSIGIWTVYKTMAHLDLAVAGIIAGLSPFIGEAMQLFFGSLGDRGYRKGLLIFGLGAGAANVLLPYTNHYFLLFLLYLLTCIGSGAFHPTGVAVSSSLTKDRKGLFVTIFASGGSLGLAFSQIIFSSWYHRFNGQTIFLALPALALVVFLLSKNLPGVLSSIAPTGQRYGFSALKKVFRCRELVILYISQVCNQAIFWGTIFLLPDVLASKGYSSWLIFGGGHLFFILGGAVVMIVGGYLSDRSSSKIILLTSTMLGFVFFYIFLLAPMIMPNMMILALLFFLGASLGVANPIAVAYGHRLLPSRPGLVSGVLMGLVWCLSEAIGPVGAGLLTKCFVENAPTKALSFFGVLFIICALVTALLPEKASLEFDLETM
jgi:FSR family fosmidomycin resistance protein-like MFS transporter